VLWSVPKPVWGGFAAFVVVLFLSVFLTTPPESKPQPTARPRHEIPKSAAATTPSAPPQPQLKVYTFTASPAAPAPTAPRTPVPSANLTKPNPAPEVRPVKVPKIDQELELVAEPKQEAPKKPAAEPAKPAEKPAVEKESAPTGATLLAQAIRLHDQGKVSEAIGLANQAVVLYQADVNAGRNVEAASRGIKNAQKLISIWQESADTGM